MRTLETIMEGRKDLDPFGWSYKLSGAPGTYGIDVAIEDMQVDEKSMSVRFCFADGNKRDGVGDLLEITGIDTSRHQKNPIVLLDHGKVVALPIAMAESPDGVYSVELDGINKKAYVTGYFYQGDLAYEHAVLADQVFDLMAKRFIRSGSVGYQVLSARELAPDYTTGVPKGLHLLGTKMLEASAVVLPANQDTVVKMLSSPVCGKKLSPYLVKSLMPFAPPRKAQMYVQGKSQYLVGPEPDRNQFPVHYTDDERKWETARHHRQATERPDGNYDRTLTSYPSDDSVEFGYAATTPGQVLHQSRYDFDRDETREMISDATNESGIRSINTGEIPDEKKSLRQKALRQKYRKALGRKSSREPMEVRIDAVDDPDGYIRYRGSIVGRGTDRVPVHGPEGFVENPIVEEGGVPVGDEGDHQLAYDRIMDDGLVRREAPIIAAGVRQANPGVDVEINDQSKGKYRGRIGNHGMKAVEEPYKPYHERKRRVVVSPRGPNDYGTTHRMETLVEGDDDLLRMSSSRGGFTSSNEGMEEGERYVNQRNTEHQQYMKHPVEGPYLKDPKTGMYMDGQGNPVELDNMAEEVEAHAASQRRKKYGRKKAFQPGDRVHYRQTFYNGDKKRPHVDQFGRVLWERTRHGTTDYGVRTDDGISRLKTDEPSSKVRVTSARMPLRVIEEPEVKSLSDTRKKHRTAKGLLWRVKRSSPGSSVIFVKTDDLKATKELADEKGLEFHRMRCSKPGVEKVKLIGHDSFSDEVAKSFGLPVSSKRGRKKAAQAMGVKSISQKSRRKRDRDNPEDWLMRDTAEARRYLDAAGGELNEAYHLMMDDYENPNSANSKRSSNHYLIGEIAQERMHDAHDHHVYDAPTRQSRHAKRSSIPKAEQDRALHGELATGQPSSSQGKSINQKMNKRKRDGDGSINWIGGHNLRSRAYLDAAGGDLNEAYQMLHDDYNEPNSPESYRGERDPKTGEYHPPREQIQAGTIEDSGYLIRTIARERMADMKDQYEYGPATRQSNYAKRTAQRQKQEDVLHGDLNTEQPPSSQGKSIDQKGSRNRRLRRQLNAAGGDRDVAYENLVNNHRNPNHPAWDGRYPSDAHHRNIVDRSDISETMGGYRVPNIIQGDENARNIAIERGRPGRTKRGAKAFKVGDYAKVRRASDEDKKVDTVNPQFIQHGEIVGLDDNNVTLGRNVLLDMGKGETPVSLGYYEDTHDISNPARTQMHKIAAPKSLDQIFNEQFKQLDDLTKNLEQLNI